MKYYRGLHHLYHCSSVGEKLNKPSHLTPLPVRQGRAGGSIADSDQVPLTGGLGQSCADSGAAGYDDDLRPVRELIFTVIRTNK